MPWLDHDDRGKATYYQPLNSAGKPHPAFKGLPKKAAKKRWVPAPNDTGQVTGNAVFGVFLGTNERVEWAYTIMPDGRRVVTGYDILPVLSPELEDDLLQRLSS